MTDGFRPLFFFLWNMRAVPFTRSLLYSSPLTLKATGWEIIFFVLFCDCAPTTAEVSRSPIVFAVRASLNRCSPFRLHFRQLFFQMLTAFIAMLALVAGQSPQSCPTPTFDELAKGFWEYSLSASNTTSCFTPPDFPTTSRRCDCTLHQTDPCTFYFTPVRLTGTTVVCSDVPDGIAGFFPFTFTWCESPCPGDSNALDCSTADEKLRLCPAGSSSTDPNCTAVNSTLSQIEKQCQNWVKFSADSRVPPFVSRQAEANWLKYCAYQNLANLAQRQITGGLQLRLESGPPSHRVNETIDLLQGEFLSPVIEKTADASLSAYLQDSCQYDGPQRWVIQGNGFYIPRLSAAKSPYILYRFVQVSGTISNVGKFVINVDRPKKSRQIDTQFLAKFEQPKSKKVYSI